METERLEQDLRNYFKAEVKRVEPSPEWWNNAISRLGEQELYPRPAKPAFGKFRPSLVTALLSVFLFVLLVGSFVPMLGGMAPPPPPAPAMVSDDSGGAFLVWQENPWNPDSALVAQHIDAQGNLAWGKDGLQLAVGYAGQLYAVGDNSGGIIVAWKDDSGSHLHRLGRDGRSIWVRENFSSRSVMGMVKDGSGGAILLLGNTDDTDNRIYAQRVSAEGKFLWGENGTFLGYNQDVHRGESLASDGLGGVVIIWQEQGKDYSLKIRAQRLSPAGLPLWGDNGIIVVSMEQAQGNNHDIIADGMGNFFIAWDTGSLTPDTDVYVQKLDRNGAKLWGEKGILVCKDQVTGSYSPANIQSYPQMAADGSGGVIVTWHDRRRIMNREVFAQRINAAGEKLWAENGVWVWDIPAEYLMTTSGILNATVIPDGASGAIIVWTGYEGSYTGNSVIYVQRLSPDGQRLWLHEKVYNDPSFQSQGYAGIVSDGQGGVIIGSRVGESSNLSKTNSVYTQRIDSQGNRIWGKSGLAIHEEPSALTVQFIAVGAILAAALVLIGVFRRNRTAEILTAILPVLLGIAGLFSIILVIGPFGYAYGWAYVPDTALNKCANLIVPLTGLVIALVGTGKKTVTRWVMIPITVFCILITVIAGLIFAL